MRRKNPLIGFAPFGVHVGIEDATGRQFIDYELLDASKAAIEDQNIDIISPDCVIARKNQAFEALEQFRSADIDALVLYSTTWMWASEIAFLAQDIRRPVLLWSPATSRGWTNVGALEVHGALDEIDLDHKFIIGQHDDPETISAISAFCKASWAVQCLRGMTLGLVGGRGMGETTGAADPSQWMRIFGIDIEHMDQMVVIEESKAVSAEDVAMATKEISKKFDYLPEPSEVMDRSVRMYVALKKIYREKDFDLAAVKCYPELGDGYATPCLAQSLLADEGYTSACIGDLNTALTAQVAGYFSEEAIFSGDIQQVVYDKNIIKIVCDGGCPPSLAGGCKDCGVCMRGLPSEGEAGGMGISAVLKAGRCTLAHLARVGGEFVMQIAPGEVFEPPKDELDSWLRECGMPHWAHAYVKIDGDGRRFYQHQRGEFVSLAYGDISRELVSFCEMAGIEPLLP
jgi:L-fucose isomerase-like protein